MLLSEAAQNWFFVSLTYAVMGAHLGVGAGLYDSWTDDQKERFKDQAANATSKYMTADDLGLALWLYD